MQAIQPQPTTFVEMVLLLLEDRFPWLGTQRSVSGAEALDALNALHLSLKKARSASRRKERRRTR